MLWCSTKFNGCPVETIHHCEYAENEVIDKKHYISRNYKVIDYIKYDMMQTKHNLIHIMQKRKNVKYNMMQSSKHI